MPSKKLRPKKTVNLLFLLAITASWVLASGCITKPPNVPVCSGNDAPDYFVLLKEFRKICGDDVVCAQSLPDWDKKIKTWTVPTDSGHCVETVTGVQYDIDHKNKLVVGWDQKTNQPIKKSWLDLSSDAILAPAAEAWAPMKTWTQTICHKNPNVCDEGVGNWERRVQDVDALTKAKK